MDTKSVQKKSLLRIENLSAGYGDYAVLSDISLEIEQGTISLLMGPNGAGKSTLLKSIYSIPTVTAGEIYFDGEKITDLEPHELLERGIAFVSQGKINFGTLTVEENLYLGSIALKDQKTKESNLEKMYEQFPVLQKKKDQYAFSLSGGEQQMLAIGRALMGNPKCILMDEPSLGLAPKLVKEVFQLIAEIRDTYDTTIIVVEHNVQSLFSIADYGFILVNGKLVAHDTCAVLQTSEILKKVFVGTFE